MSHPESNAASSELQIFVDHPRSHTFTFDHFRVETAALADASFLRFKIAADQSERRAFALRPFEIIDERPVIIALDGQVVVLDFLYMIIDVRRAKKIFLVAGAVLGDPDRCVIT